MLTAHDKFNEIIEEAQKGNSIFNAGNVIKVEEVENEKEIYSQLSFEYPENEELNNILSVKEESIKYGLSNKISNLLVKNVENIVFNDEKDKLTDEDKNQIKKSIEEEIKQDEDFGKIYEKNKNPIEAWINENVVKTHTNILKKFMKKLKG